MAMLFKISLTGAKVIFFSAALFSQSTIPLYQNPEKPIDERVAHLLPLLTLEEKANLLSGKDLWHLEGVARLGIPSIQVTDCGHGITVILNEDGNYTGCATCFPTGVAQAATWNRQLQHKIGQALAREARALGSTILLAPMVNIHRTPLNGRNYETYSEDPYLAGTLAASFINGVQSQHIGTCIKAFTANNQQAHQHEISAEISERALREIYFPAFKIPIMKARPWSLMTCYNKVNGQHTSESQDLLKKIKDEWRFDGFIMSDWRATFSAQCIPAGLDLEMPGPGKFMRQQDILQALENGVISEEELNDRVGRILKAIFKAKLLDATPPKSPTAWNSPAHQMLALRTAEESIVLLKNAHNLLPLDNSKIKKLAVIGPNAKEARLGGGGSASVTACYSVSPLAGLQNYCGTKIDFSFEEGCSMKGSLPIVYSQYLRTTKNNAVVEGLRGEYFNGAALQGDPVCTRVDDKIDFSWGWATPCAGIDKLSYSARWTGQLIPPVTGEYRLGLTCTEAGCRLFLDDSLRIDAWGESNTENFEAQFSNDSQAINVFLHADSAYEIRVEFFKKSNKNSIRLEWQIPGQENPIAEAVQLARQSDVAIICAGLSNVFEGGNNDRDSLDLPGDQNKLISQVAHANPHTVVVLINGAPVAMPWIDEVDAVLEAYYPGQEGGTAIARVLFGEVNPSGKLPETFPKRLEDTPTFDNYPGENGRVRYTEGIYVGYRFYDSKKVEPLFAFGHGLSYTTFDYSDLQLEFTAQDSIIAHFQLSNSGNRAGAEVVQLYLGDVACSVDRPRKELKGFEKVFLLPGEQNSVSFVLSKKDLAFYSEQQEKWVVEPGEFKVLIGSSSRDLRLSKILNIE
jgi:beta-glucosidase